jgi:hypothetical protein
MPEREKGASRMVNVQLTADLRESLNILKKRYKVTSKAAALRQFIEDHDRRILEAGIKLAEIASDAAEEDEDDE